MGFGTESQIGNRTGGGSFPGLGGGSIGTGLADIFRNNIGAPQQIGTTQQPNQLFTLLQSLMGGEQGMQPPQFGGGGFGGPPGIGKPPQGGVPIIPGPQITPQQPGGTALSGITAQPPMTGGATGTSLSNPFGSLINQRFAR